MLERFRGVKSQFDQTMFRYGNARARVYMENNRMEAGYDLETQELPNYIQATQLVAEWHNIVGSTQLIAGIALMGGAKLTDSKYVRVGAIATGGLLLLAAGKSFLDRQYYTDLNEAAKQDLLLQGQQQNDAEALTLKILGDLFPDARM